MLLFKAASAKKLAREVGIIVLGVLIALGLGKIVEANDLDERRTAARVALRAELSINLYNAIERRHIAGCVKRRLDEIEIILEGSSAARRLPRVEHLNPPPLRLWPGITWDTVVASQTASLLRVTELNELAMVYGTAGDLRAWSRDERAAWTSLSSILGDGRPMSDAEEASLRDALATARMLSRLMPAISGQLVGDVQRTGVRLSVDRTALREASWGVCDPIVARN